MKKFFIFMLITNSLQAAIVFKESNRTIKGKKAKKSELSLYEATEMIPKDLEKHLKNLKPMDQLVHRLGLYKLQTR